MIELKRLHFLLIFSFLCLFNFGLNAQFDGPTGTLGSKAIHKDSSVFVAWASAAQLNVSFQNVLDQSLGPVVVGNAFSAIGVPDGTDVLSLGDGGSVILTFDRPIINEQGPDFAVFENSFHDAFLEFAFVEVSSDGVNFYRFPAVSNTTTNTQVGAFDAIVDASKVNNLAGKYRVLYGTPFDLEELAGLSNLDIQAITHVKLIDVVGSVDPNYGSYDVNNNLINDPFPTPFASCGFDLDGVGVIHQKPLSLVTLDQTNELVFYPSLIQSGENVKFASKFSNEDMDIANVSGQIIWSGKVSSFESSHLNRGVYYLKLKGLSGNLSQKIMVY
jgi:hypothetical protein